MAGLFERMGLVRTEYEGMPEIPMQPVSEPMGSFDCAVKGGDYGMGNAFETYPLAVMTHLADMGATYLVEGLAAK